MASLIWDTLVWRDPADFSYQPLLAKAWRQIDDATLEFDLRDDVTFHDGSRFTAADVVGTLNTVAVPGFKALAQRNVNWIAAAVQIGMYRVRIISKLPFPPALDYIANALPIYPAEHYDAVGHERMGEHPIGTGPYRMVSVETGKAYRMVRNDNYFKGSPKGDHFIKTIDVREVPDEQARVAELLAHRADIIWDLGNDQLQQITRRSGLQGGAGGDDARGLSRAGCSRTQPHAGAAERRCAPGDRPCGGPSIDRAEPDRRSRHGCLMRHAIRRCSAASARRRIATTTRPTKSRDLLRASGYEGKVAFDFYVDPTMQAAGEAVAIGSCQGRHHRSAPHAGTCGAARGAGQRPHADGVAELGRPFGE